MNQCVRLQQFVAGHCCLLTRCCVAALHCPCTPAFVTPDMHEHKDDDERRCSHHSMSPRALLSTQRKPAREHLVDEGQACVEPLRKCPRGGGESLSQGHVGVQAFAAVRVLHSPSMDQITDLRVSGLQAWTYRRVSVCEEGGSCSAV